MLSSSSVSPSRRPRLNPDRAQLEEEEAGAFSSSPGSSSSFLDLPSEVLQRVLSHFDFSERLDLALALQNKRMLAEIETYFKRVYEQIKKDHHADATFDERVNDQSDLPDSSSTGRQKPYTLSWRYRATNAMRKPLWTITVGNNRDYMPSKLVLSPLENRIAILALRVSTAHVYELATRQHVGAFGRNPVQIQPDFSLDDSLEHVFPLDNNRVITYSKLYWIVEVQHIFRIWTKSDSGEWTSERLLLEGTTDWFGGEDIWDWIPRNDQETIFFVAWSNPFQVIVVSVNIDDKSLKTLFTITGFSSIDRVRALKVVDSKWLPLAVDGAGEGCGLYVYNLETNQKTDFHAATEYSFFYDMQQSSDCPKTFFASESDGSTVVVWGLSDTGLVSERFSFSVEMVANLLAATKSHVFAQLFDGRVRVYNVSTGKCCRYLGWDVSQPRVISSSRDELYMAGPRNRIQAFCLKEPSIM